MEYENNEEISKEENVTQYLTFEIDKQYYGFDIKNVVEIAKIQEITAVPEFPSYVKGVINLRGRVIPVIDVRLRFHIEELAYNDKTCIIILNVGGIDIGFIVDTVDEVVMLNDDEIEGSPMFGNGRSTIYITGVGKLLHKIVFILDADKMFNEAEMDSFVQVSKDSELLSDNETKE